MTQTLNVMQVLPELNVGGVERGTLEVAATLIKKGHRSYVVSGGGQMVGQLEQEGSTHICLPVGKKSLLTFLLANKINKLINKYDINIIHVRSRMPAWLIKYALRKIPVGKKPAFITTVHGPYSVNFYSKIMMKSDQIIAISGFIRDYILENYPGTNEKKITVIHRGVSSQAFPFGYKPGVDWLDEWKEQYPLLQDKYLITLPSRITRWKGHDDFIEIIKTLKNKCPDIHGLIAGGAHPRRRDYLSGLKYKIEQYRLNESITFLGHRNDLKEIMSISNIVLSLANEPEAFGRTALESLYLGVPVVAYNHGGASEVLSQMLPEGLVKPRSTSEVVNCIVRFKQHRPNIVRSDLFTLDKMLNKTLELYEKCC